MTEKWMLMVFAGIGFMLAVVVMCVALIPVAVQNLRLRRHIVAAWGRDFNYGGKDYADRLLPPGFNSPVK